MWVEKHGRVWRIRDQAGLAKVTLAGGFVTKTAAKDAMTELRARELRGQALVPRGGETLLCDWVAVWQPAWEVSLKPSSQSEPARVRNHVLPLLGHLALGDITSMTVRQWVAKLIKGEGEMGGSRKRRPLKSKTVHNCHGLLYTIMQAAVDARLIPSNPCVGTKLPKRTHHEMRFLAEPEIGRLLAALPVHWRPLVLLMVTTGLRWGEAIALRVSRVDVLATPPRLRVEEALTELSSTGELVFHEPKTERSRRTVTFTHLLADALVPLVANKGRNDLVFLTVRGLIVRTRNFRRVWLVALERAGLDGLRIHDLRHTHASILISAGRPLTAVQQRLGHSSIAVTSDLYGHLLPHVDEGILAAIDEAMAGITPEMLEAEIEAEIDDPLDQDGGVLGGIIPPQATTDHHGPHAAAGQRG